MALIKVGIHENLTFTDKTKINEHGTLELGIAVVQDPDSLLNAFEGNETFTAMESSFRFYPPSMKDFDQVDKTAAEIGADILKLRHQLLTYAKLVATKEEAEKALGGLAMFKGLGIADDQIKKALSMLNQEDFMKKVVTNLCAQFVNFMKSKNALKAGAVLFRHKFLRQSKAKNFAVIPTSDFDTWVEPMDVPKAASKIAFSEWEIENGKNNPDPVSSTASESTTEDANKAASLFSTPTAPATDTATQPDLFKPAE
jgi:hypothetical protein